MSGNRFNINRDWKFLRDDAPGAEAVGFDDSGWQSVGLPHTFDLPYFRTPEFYVGVGWYRKRIDADAFVRNGQNLLGRLEFDGAFQVADVFFNGRCVGGHRGGYTGFCIELGEMKPGENVLVVRVSNEWNAQIAPRAGEHIFSGGLYRDVHLVFYPGLHVCWNGVCVTTPRVSRGSAVVHVATELCNALLESERVSVRQTVLDPDGLAVAIFEAMVTIPPQSCAKVEQESGAIVNPKLWHPDHPHLYTVLTEMVSDGVTMDRIETAFGFRWFEWTADRGFFLNGEHCYLRGANAHQDQAGWGIAITQAACRRDVRLIKDAGFNFVRGAHYPHHPAFADACDELGVIFWSENCFWGKGGFGPEGYWNASAYPVNEGDIRPFEDHCRQTLREMIRINRNHPSIVIWSMTNEAFFTYNLDRAREFMRELVRLSKRLDPDRPAAIGGAQRGGVDYLGDVAGYNGDGARLFIDPGVPNMVSEYGAISKPHDAYDPFFGDLQQERFRWRAGEAIWCAFDYGSIAGRQGLKGILHHNRLPKRSWYWYRDALRQIPPPAWPIEGVAARLHLSADKTVLHGTDATDDCLVVVTVLNLNGVHLSNCPTITLMIESGPGEFPTGQSITFESGTDISIVDGQAAIAFRSYEGGRTIIRATSSGMEDAVLAITTVGEPEFSPGVTLRGITRPYSPPAPSPAAVAAMNNVVNVARDRPSRASSERATHPARFANDADSSTFWQAAEDASGAWLQVDLEGFYQLSGLKLAFPIAGNYKYIVDVSEDGKRWALAIDRRQTIRTDRARHDVFDPGTVARYVRLTFTDIPRDVPAGIRGFEVHGILSVR